MKITFDKNCPVCHGSGQELIPFKYGEGYIGMQTCRLCTQRAKDLEEFKELCSPSLVGGDSHDC
ncbi:hypothetical protein BGL36_05770 [Fructilactobacillus lindneri]|nr:hypothetical protein BGL35_06140 [Fructilactobacillus lindneri]POH05924.1 hypothetical protein BGL36_05770 [Fructilactobacillus lindneri]POH22831.1 hypothetical protein BHU33_06140 [Fructilactobacillus lindneri DSM 20690 = JCM 11027]SKA08002.1 hypothetical protein SAMN02746042_01421 [Fructilactobacillus lindneri DSM 20690 = JCM 11027]